MLRSGVNYTPSAGWFYSWYEPDFDVVRRDLEAVAALGLDHVRVLPLWPVLQPNRTLIRERALDDVRTTVEIAAASGLDASVDVLQGHLSSFDFVPSWLTTWHARNLFTDPEVVEAQVRLVDALDERLHDVPGFLGLTLGNELNQFAAATHPSPMPATPAQVTSWLEALLAAPRRDPRQHRVHAPYDAVWYADGHPFQPAHVARHGDLSIIHSWVFNGTAQGYGATGPHGTGHAAYLVELARAFAEDPDRPVWLQEVGAPTPHVPAEAAADFCEDTVRAAADSPALWGVTWWCSHDVPRALGDFPDLEHSLGLFDEGGVVKELGLRFGRVMAELREAPVPAPRRTAVVVPVDDEDVPLSRAELGPGGGVFETWADLAASGERPTLVTSRTAADPAALARRDVDRVVAAPVTGRSHYSSVSDAEMFPAGVGDG
ncbi:glycosyl hydrolase [Cellulomonas triticagri]|uniref:Glycosyl hydrolase n=2 Tax=Cellulomonas triticagri TaxID=2483352 RepID=A0A3M2JGK9_9CELL|nr:glycosyl hydrolase [Cellulomonas triticagri]